MKILLASSELFPYSKTGGLSDMVGALAKALAADGHQVTAVTPLYRGIAAKHPGLAPTGIEIRLPLGPAIITARVLAAEPAPNLKIYFIDQPAFFDRPALYGEAGRDYPDNAARFIFFAKAVADLARNFENPDLVHVHDWQAGLVPLFIRHQALATGWRNPPATITTIHNLAYQGVFPSSDYPLTNLPWDYFTSAGAEYYLQLNCLKAGLVYADLLTTVSPRYAREITTPEYGCGLDGVLRARQDRLLGILNGVDYAEWNTDRNKFLKHPYTAEDLAGKNLEKSDLQREFGLPVLDAIPLFGTVSRLAEQKGVDIQIAALEEMLAAPMQFILLGSGDPAFERGFLRLAERHPAKAAVRIGYDHPLAHRIEAASDFFLMPSRFEPCGLNQMYSLRYATIPIVRATGGLDDSVTDPAENPDLADGLKFTEYTPRALAKAIRKALVLYQDKPLLHHFRQNALRADYSWSSTTHQYESAFQKALALKKQPLG